MPLIAHTGLPTFERLRNEGLEVIEPQRAAHQDIRELHIGLLNMMPDAALEATERQFLRLIGACNRIAQFYVHLFTFPEIPRGERAQEHIDRYYWNFDALKLEGLDAMIFTGANPASPDITKEPFWDPLFEVVNWTKENVSSVACSCLATHAIAQQLWGIERYRLPEKRWGVYSHRIANNTHPLVENINTRFDAPHSHVYDVNGDQFHKAGLPVLVESEEAGLYLAVSPDQFRFVFFQGHPEYDIISLLKEYKREVQRFLGGQREDYPPFPENYFPPQAAKLFQQFKERVFNSSGGHSNLEFPEHEALPLIDNTWSDTGKAIFNNWLGLVYQLTHTDRRKPFMDGIDPEDPLGLRGDGPSGSIEPVPD